LKLFCETNVAPIEFTYLIVQFAFQMDCFVSGHDSRCKNPQGLKPVSV